MNQSSGTSFCPRAVRSVASLSLSAIERLKSRQSQTSEGAPHKPFPRRLFVLLSANCLCAITAEPGISGLLLLTDTVCTAVWQYGPHFSLALQRYHQDGVRDRAHQLRALMVPELWHRLFVGPPTTPTVP